LDETTEKAEKGKRTRTFEAGVSSLPRLGYSEPNENARGNEGLDGGLLREGNAREDSTLVPLCPTDKNANGQSLSASYPAKRGG
jgi:hypothetical protein